MGHHMAEETMTETADQLISRLLKQERSNRIDNSVRAKMQAVSNPTSQLAQNVAARYEAEVSAVELAVTWWKEARDLALRNGM